MAANGLGIDGFEKLQLERGALLALSVNGERERVEGEVAIWMKAPLAVDLPDDLRFERVDETPVELSASGLDGLFAARRFRVIDDDSGVDVDVRLAVGRSRVVVLVRGTRTARRDDVEVPTA